MSEILGIDTNNYAVQSLKSSGGGSATLQEKSVTITENGTTTIQPDEGYDGLSEVEVITNVSDLDWTEIGYTEIPDRIIEGFNYAKQIKNNWDSTITSMQNKYQNNVDILFMPLVDTSNVTNMRSAFSGCSALLKIPLLDTSNVTNMYATFAGSNIMSIPLLDTGNVTDFQYTFDNCKELIELPLFDFSKVTNFTNAFTNCPKLITVPAFNVPKAQVLYNMFASCPKLSDQSLNNIMQMCINAISFTGTKTLVQIGLSTTQKNKCKTLSNYQAFLDAGWTTG